MKNSSFQTSSQLYKPAKNTVGYNTGKIETRVRIVKKWIGMNKKVLDLGCYDGTYSEIIANNNNIVSGLDASKNAVKTAQSKGINAYVGDLESRFPFKTGFFDVIHAGEVIEHLYDTDVFIDECKRVLKKNGSMIISTPNTLSLPRRIVYLFGKGYFFEPSNSFSLEGRAVGHIRYYTFESLSKFLVYKGFSVKQMTSDFVNLPFFRSEMFARIRPTFGRSIIAEFIRL